MKNSSLKDGIVCIACQLCTFCIFIFHYVLYFAPNPLAIVKQMELRRTMECFSRPIANMTLTIIP